MESALAQALGNFEKHDGTRPDAHSRSRAKGGAGREGRSWRRALPARCRRARKSRDGRIEFPYDGVHVDFMLNGA